MDNTEEILESDLTITELLTENLKVEDIEDLADTKKHYINKKEFLKETRKSLEQGVLTDRMVEMFLLLSKRVVNAMPHTDQALKEDCESGAIEDLLRYWKGFKEEVGRNAFAYYTTVALNGSKKAFNKSYKLGKKFGKFKARIISLDHCASTNDSSNIYSL